MCDIFISNTELQILVNICSKELTFSGTTQIQSLLKHVIKYENTTFTLILLLQMLSSGEFLIFRQQCSSLEGMLTG